MIVVYLISRAKRGAGPVNQALNILIGLNRIEGVHAVLMTLSPEVEGDSWLERFQENNIEVIQLNLLMRSTWRAVSILKQYIKKNHVDIVHSSGYRADIVNMMLGNRVGTVSTQRNQPGDLLEKYPLWKRAILQKLHTYIIKKFDAVVGCSKSIQESYGKELGMSIYAVQNGVNTDSFVPASLEEKVELRKELGIDAEKRIYLILGWLGPRKNVKMIIEAFKSIDKDDVQIIVLGDGDNGNELKIMASDDRRFIFLGKIGNPLPYIQISDILISSSMAEGLPNTVLEALSCGLPCILSDIDPHKELIGETEAGVLFDRHDVNDLVNKIRDSFKWDIAAMSKKANNLAVQCFSIDKLANNYLAIYETVRNYHSL